MGEYVIERVIECARMRTGAGRWTRLGGDLFCVCIGCARYADFCFRRNILPFSYLFREPRASQGREEHSRGKRAPCVGEDGCSFRLREVRYALAPGDRRYFHPAWHRRQMSVESIFRYLRVEGTNRRMGVCAWSSSVKRFFCFRLIGRDQRALLVDVAGVFLKAPERFSFTCSGLLLSFVSPAYVRAFMAGVCCF